MCKKICETASMFAAVQRDLADRDAEISRLNAAIEKGAQTAEQLHRQLDEQVRVSQALRKQDEWQIGRIAELEGSNKERWDRIQYLERQRETMIQDMEKQETAHTSDHLELVARREECAKLQGLLDQMTSWRDGAARECDKLGIKLVNMTNNYGHQRDESTRLAEELRLMTADRDGWKETGRTEQQNKIKARDQRDEETKARQRVQIQLDKATARITELEGAIAAPGCRSVALFHAEQRLAEKEGECRALRDSLNTNRLASNQKSQRIAELREKCEKLDGVTDNQTRCIFDQNNQLVDLRRKLAELNESTAPAPVLEVAACACDDLQKQLSGLHKAGKVILLDLPMSNGSITFIESLTRSGELLNSINEKID